MIPLDALPPMPTSHRGLPITRHMEAYMPVRIRRATHFGHRPGSLSGCTGKRCAGMAVKG